MDSIEIPMDDVAVDTGAPREYTNDPTPATEKPEPTATERELAALKADNDRQARELTESRQSAEFWAKQAKTATRQPAPEAEADEVDETASDVADDTPDKMLDDMSAQGIKALEKRGLITVKEMDRRLKAMEERLTGQIAATGEGAEFDRQMGNEFPDLAADHAKIEAWKRGGERGDKPQTSEMWKRTGEHYRDLTAGENLTPSQDRALMRKAAQLAKKELSLTSDTRSQRQEDRSDRIAAQRGTRGRGASDEERGTRALTGQQLEVAKRLGVSEGEFTKQVERRAARGRN